MEKQTNTASLNIKRTVAALAAIGVLGAGGAMVVHQNNAGANAAAAGAPAAPVAAAPTPAPRPAPAPKPAAAPTEAQKLNAYVNCYNSVDKRAHEAMSRYRKWVQDMANGPTGKERAILGVYTVSESGVLDCAKSAEMAATEPSFPDIDAAVKPYATAVTAWAASLEEADKYYTRQDYKDDQMAKGKALHADLVKHYEAFDTASKAFSKSLDAANDKRQAEQLVELEKTEGRKFNYWHVATMVSAKKLTRLLTQDSFDMDQANAALKNFEDAAQGLDDFTKSASKDELPLIHSSLGSSAEGTLVAAKQRIRRVRDKEPYRSGDLIQIQNGNAWLVSGTPDALVRKYNELIDASNRLR